MKLIGPGSLVRSRRNGYAGDRADSARVDDRLIALNLTWSPDSRGVRATLRSQPPSLAGLVPFPSGLVAQLSDETPSPPPVPAGDPAGRAGS